MIFENGFGAICLCIDDSFLFIKLIQVFFVFVFFYSFPLSKASVGETTVWGANGKPPLYAVHAVST